MTHAFSKGIFPCVSRPHAQVPVEVRTSDPLGARVRQQWATGHGNKQSLLLNYLSSSIIPILKEVPCGSKVSLWNRVSKDVARYPGLSHRWICEPGLFTYCVYCILLTCMPSGQKRAPDLITDSCEPPCGCQKLNQDLQESTHPLSHLSSPCVL